MSSFHVMILFYFINGTITLQVQFKFQIFIYSSSNVSASLDSATNVIKLISRQIMRCRKRPSNFDVQHKIKLSSSFSILIHKLKEFLRWLAKVFHACSGYWAFQFILKCRAIAFVHLMFHFTQRRTKTSKQTN